VFLFWMVRSQDVYRNNRRVCTRNVPSMWMRLATPNRSRVSTCATNISCHGHAWVGSSESHQQKPKCFYFGWCARKTFTTVINRRVCTRNVPSTWRRLATPNRSRVSICVTNISSHGHACGRP